MNENKIHNSIQLFQKLTLKGEEKKKRELGKVTGLTNMLQK